MIVVIVNVSFAQASVGTVSPLPDIVDTAPPNDPLTAPAIVINPASIEPDCHTYTGCSVIIIKKYTPSPTYKHRHNYDYEPPLCCVY